MSYILDALKKAERDRGLARVPTVMTVHELREARRSRLWVLAAGIVVCAAAAIVFLLLYPRARVQPPAPSRASVEPAGKPSEPEIAPEPAKPVESARKVPAPKPRAVLPKEIEQKAAAPVAPVTPPPAPAASAAAPAAKAEPLKEAAEKMNLSILVYDENKADRLVFINGAKYVEGDYVDGTYLLKSITPDGVVLVHEKEELLLRPGSK
jgi:general secretion pathway protein B